MAKATINRPTIKAFSSDVSVVEGERAVTAVITTDAVDRDGEVVIPQGVDAKEFQKNPVIFFNHAWQDYAAEMGDKLPVGKCTAISRDADSITAKIVFADRPATHPADDEWLPDTLLSLYQQGVMNAFSIGFTPTETRPATDKDVSNFGAGVRGVISKCKLFEISCVPLPCNQEAVTLAVSKGMIKQATADRIFAKAATPAIAEGDAAAKPELKTAVDAMPAVATEVAAVVAQPTETPSLAVAEPAAPVATPTPAAKHVKFVIEPPTAAAAPTPSSADAVAAEIAKRRGRLYFI